MEINEQLEIILKGVAQHSEASEFRMKLEEAAKEGRPLRIKFGLDPSAPDIHIGHAVPLRKIRQMQEMGHQAVIIIGDYTGTIGDPSGKSKTRKQLSKEAVKKNAETYLAQIFKIIDRERTEVHYNSEWLSKMNFEDVLILASKCTVARMLERDDFHNRYTNHLPLSVHEFFYPLMQAYDSVAVRADLELGGTDQTFNIMMGRNIQRDYGQKPQCTLLMPLLEGIDGVEKMSKSLGNYIGIDEEPFAIFEKVMKIPDGLILKYYNLCTDCHPKEIAQMEKRLAAGDNPRDIKEMLAHEITSLYAGNSAADQAKVQFRTVYQMGQAPADAPRILLAVQGDKASLAEQLLAALAEGKFFFSKSEIRRLFAQGGVQLDGQKVMDFKEFSPKEGEHMMKLGKNKDFIVEVREDK